MAILPAKIVLQNDEKKADLLHDSISNINDFLDSYDKTKNQVTVFLRFSKLVFEVSRINELKLQNNSLPDVNDRMKKIKAFLDEKYFSIEKEAGDKAKRAFGKYRYYASNDIKITKLGFENITCETFLKEIAESLNKLIHIISAVDKVTTEVDRRDHTVQSYLVKDKSDIEFLAISATRVLTDQVEKIGSLQGQIDLIVSDKQHALLVEKLVQKQNEIRAYIESKYTKQ